jgi:excisionase family DNA binding protein
MQTQVGDYLTIEGVARMLDVGYFTARRLILKRGLPVIRLGKSILIRVDDAKQLATKQ